MKKRIPEKFFNGDDHPIAYTVKQLRGLLSELPDDLNVNTAFGDGVMLVVYNHGERDEELIFEEGD
jgi:hypothetical protein